LSVDFPSPMRFAQLCHMCAPGIRAYGHDGELIMTPEMDDLRRQAELFHRIKIEL
jgi:hypothetical protein